MPALSGFGITLTLGIGIAVLIAPAVLVLAEHSGCTPPQQVGHRPAIQSVD
jgi:hypothetical protein